MELDPAYRIPLAINLCSTLIYMTNYYITQPSATVYVNALDGHDALSAMLIGAMPLAALLTSFLYSWWTNYSYRAPLIFTAVVLCVGNLLYASALSMNSLTAALAGRFIMGLGHQRTINKRFLADTAPAHLKTAVAAAFSMAQALGMVLGPGFAIALGRLDTEFTMAGVPILLNGMTGPGYFMFTIWFVYLVVTVLVFEEPVRTGLHELRQKEDRDSAALLVGMGVMGACQPSIPHRGSPATACRGPLDVIATCQPSMIPHPAAQSALYDGPDVDQHPSWVSIVSQNDAEISVDANSIYRIASNDDDESKTGAAGLFAVESGQPVPEISVGEKTTTTRNLLCSCLELTTPAIWLVMFLAFTNKFSIEMVISSTSTLTKNRYGWALSEVGILGAVDGIMVIPLSFFVGWLSQHVEDRSLLTGLLALSVLGTALLVDPTDLRQQSGESYNEGLWASVGPKQYIVGSLLSFASLQACESVITSQLSKVVPHSLAKGTFNSGLLSTLVGAVSICVRQRRSGFQETNRNVFLTDFPFLRAHASLGASSLQPWAT